MNITEITLIATSILYPCDTPVLILVVSVDKDKKKNMLHKLKAATFYNRKRQAKSNAKKDFSYEGITITFAKNLPVPNITTNDVYYRRQLSVHSFNIHILLAANQFFFSYPEIIAHRGANLFLYFIKV